MAEIENTNNLTLAQLIEIWETCNSSLNCPKRPLYNTNCAEILHTATLEALKNLVQLVDLQKEEIDDYKRDTIPRLQDALNRANKYGMDADKELELLRTKNEKLHIKYTELRLERMSTMNKINEFYVSVTGKMVGETE